MTPPAHERKIRHTKSDLVKFFADRPVEFGQNPYVKDHPGALAAENRLQFTWRVFKDEVTRAVKEETELECQSSESEGSAPYRRDVDTDTHSSFEVKKHRQLLDDSIAARKKCAYEVIERISIQSLLGEEDRVWLKCIIAGNYVSERS